jgi:hypothetical protein
MKSRATRVVARGMGFALGASAGALPILSRLAEAFMGGTTGNGDQYINWIRVNDLSAMFDRSIESPEIPGPFSITGPVPATN